MYIWFMLGHGAATGEMHVYICVCDEPWKNFDERFFRISSGLALPGMLGAMSISYCCI